MDQAYISEIISSALFTIIKVSAPVLLVAVIIGLIISILQAATQINEQTLVMIPKIIGILLAVIIFGNWMLTILSEYTIQLFTKINTFIK